MNLNWLRFDYIPPELGVSREQRKRVKRWLRERDDLLFLKALPLLIPWFALYIVWLFWLSEAILGEPLSGLAGALELIAFVAIGHLLVSMSMRRTRVRQVREALRNEGYELCLNCGYWLRGLPDDAKQCPECGAEREPMPETTCASAIEPPRLRDG